MYSTQILCTGSRKKVDYRYRRNHHERQGKPENALEPCRGNQPFLFHEGEGRAMALAPVEVPEQSGRDVQDRRGRDVEQPEFGVLPVAQQQVQVVRPAGREHPEAQRHVQLRQGEFSLCRQVQHPDYPWRAEEGQYRHEGGVDVIPGGIAGVGRDNGESNRRHGEGGNFPRHKQELAIRAGGDGELFGIAPDNRQRDHAGRDPGGDVVIEERFHSGSRSGKQGRVGNSFYRTASVMQV